MRMIAGSILILAASVLFAAHWIGQVMHNSTVVGNPEAMYVLAAAAFLAMFGGTIATLELVSERERPDPPRGKP